MILDAAVAADGSSRRHIDYEGNRIMNEQALCMGFESGVGPCLRAAIDVEVAATLEALFPRLLEGV